MPSLDSEKPRGFAFAVSAYLIWGLIVPAYMKFLGHIPAIEIMAQRILWAVPFSAAVLLVLGKFRGLAPVLRSPRTLALATLTASIISLNWSLYVYAIVSGHAIQAALGYYINPLINIVMGAVFLGERPTRMQGVAIALAALAVAVLTVDAGGLPWVALVLAVSFGVYGLLRKILPIGATEGFFLEVLILSVPCLGIIAWTIADGSSRFTASAFDALLLVGAGPLTAIPLILYAASAKILDYSTIGILQYIAPTALFLTAVFVFGEPFSQLQLLAFALIWAAVAVYVASMLRTARARRQGAMLEGACPS